MNIYFPHIFYIHVFKKVNPGCQLLEKLKQPFWIKLGKGWIFPNAYLAAPSFLKNDARGFDCACRDINRQKHSLSSNAAGFFHKYLRRSTAAGNDRVPIRNLGRSTRGAL